jgi:tetratricopeptide (TPR) repeat protein
MANLAKVAVARGQVHQAEQVCNQALALLADTESRALRAIVLWQRGEARLAMARDDDGLDDLEHAVQHAEASGNKGLTTILLTRQVEAFASRGNLDAAHAALERAQAVCPHSERALVAVANGALQVARGDPELAKVSLQTARNHTQDTQAGPGSPLALAMARLSAALHA